MYTDKNGDIWYRGNLHTHTTLSDGKKTPEESKKVYKNAGYDFISLTDHWVFGENCENDESGLCVLSGAEYDFGGSDTLNGVFHIVGIGMESDPMEVLTRNSSPQDAVDEISKRGGVSVFAHPAWSLNTWDMMASVNNYTMTEIYNSISAAPKNCRPYSGDVIDKLALRGYFPLISAADDTHFWEGEEIRSFIYVNLHKNTLNRENLINALKNGEFFATQGPRFCCHLEKCENNYKFVVECEEADNVERVTIFDDRPWTNNRSVVGEKLTRAEFILPSDFKFVRAEVYSGENVGWGQIFDSPRT